MSEEERTELRIEHRAGEILAEQVAELLDKVDEYERFWQDALKRRDKAEAEVERLRAVLSAIANYRLSLTEPPVVMNNLARAALISDPLQ